MAVCSLPPHAITNAKTAAITIRNHELRIILIASIRWLFSYTAGLPAIVAKRSVCEKRESVYSSGMDYMRTIHLGQRLSRLNCPSKLVFAFVGLTKTSNGLQSSFSGSLYVGTVETTIRLDGIISSP